MDTAPPDIAGGPDAGPQSAAPQAVVAGYPGPAIRFSADLTPLSANAVATELLDGDPRWLEEVYQWLGESRVAPGLHATPVFLPRGLMVVEWAATPLDGGEVLLLGRDVTLERQLRQTLTESRQRYKDLVEASSDFAWETGDDGRFVFVTPKGALGYAVEDLVGSAPRRLMVEEWGDLPLPFDTRRAVDQAELWLRRADGASSCVVVSALPLFGVGGEWRGARGVCRDITDQVMRVSELARVRNREKLLAHIVHTLRDQLDAAEALTTAAVETARALGADGCRIYRVLESGGLMAAAEFIAPGASDPSPEALAPVLAQVRAMGSPSDSDEPVGQLIGRTRLLAARTEYRHQINGAMLVWRDHDPDAWDYEDMQLFAGVADHIGIAHAHLAYQERLRRLSERDGLTGLFNRRTFFERLEEQLARPESGPSALLYVDLDNFKAVNDLHGHQAGDAALKSVGMLLSTGVRPGDLPGRLGGDEFVLWLGRTDESHARIVGERLLAGMAGLQHLSASPDRPLGLSIGIAIHRTSLNETVQELTDRADAAMYVAKAHGKGNFAFAPMAGAPPSPEPAP
jgi:diguanylate cyclase (GGDEF)-like protein/PAS domain S-box-containing protein